MLYWFFHLIADQFLQYHHECGRLLGYLEFYIQTKNLRRLPFYISSIATNTIILMSTLVNDFCNSDKGKSLKGIVIWSGVAQSVVLKTESPLDKKF